MNKRIAIVLVALNLSIACVFQLHNMDFHKGDFQVFYYAAQHWLNGSPVYGAAAGVYRDGVVRAFINPAYSLLLFVPFAVLPYKFACWLWLAVILGLAVLCGYLLDNYWAVLAAAPFVFVLAELQNTTLLLLCVTGCWLLLKRERMFWAGVVLGLAVFKFTIVVPIALMLCIWRPKFVTGFLASCVPLTALSLLMVSKAETLTYIHYMLRMSQASASPEYGRESLLNQMTLRGLAELFHLGNWQILLFAAVFALACYVVRRSSAAEAISVAVICGLLFAVHLSVHDELLLAVPFVLLGRERKPLYFFYLPGCALLLLTVPYLHNLTPFLPISVMALLWRQRYSERVMRSHGSRVAGSQSPQTASSPIIESGI